MKARGTVVLLVFLNVVVYHARLVEIISRLDLMWKRQAKSELNEIAETRKHNATLLSNMLPDHVAAHFLSDMAICERGLYHQWIERVGVMFASIPNFMEFYSEDVNKGVECIRLLNEIIVDFDELLDDPKLDAHIEKIKTIGASYMAVSGLRPTLTDNGNDECLESTKHLCALVEFAIAMKQRLEIINRHSYNAFQLRVGIHFGPLVGGVIGARKPVFDVWGDTVNIASRMDSTGEPGRIQVPSDTADKLRQFGFSLDRRGLIDVKGKDKMETYFVRTGGSCVSVQRNPSSAHRSLAAVVYGVVNARRKDTVRRAIEQKPGSVRVKGEQPISPSGTISSPTTSVPRRARSVKVPSLYRKRAKNTTTVLSTTEEIPVEISNA